MIRNLCLAFLLFVLGACQSDNKISQESVITIAKVSNSGFVLKRDSESGIDFSNDIEDTKDFNILNYRNFYNGGGVALGDVNNDGFVDIYFTANQNENKLFINQKDFTFTDATEAAKVGGTKSWSTGVTMVDINADGWLDIYVCNSGDVLGGNKENELFINNQDGTFTEDASSYGLDDAGYSTHASFFDYDLDGDLDCYLLNNSFKSPGRIDMISAKRDEIDELGGDKLLRNDGGEFINVSQAAGIYSSSIGFGLGVSVSDINGDLLPDIYVSNDFWERDYFYRNLGNGKFVEELEQRFSHISLNSMGADIGDLDNDGLVDIMTTDMLPADNYRRKTMTQFDPYRQVKAKQEAGYHLQYLQNAVHKNLGNGDFQDVAFQTGLAATDWSWGTLFFDMDNNGFKDIFISNGINKDLTDFDFVDFITDKTNVDNIVKEKGRADIRDYLPYMPSTPLKNYAFLNQGNMQFSNQAAGLGLGTKSFSNGASYGDLDNDGDLDLVVNNVNMPPFIYENKLVNTNHLKVVFEGAAKNPFGIGAKAIIQTTTGTQEYQHFLSRGFQSSVAPHLVIGLGADTIVESLVIQWPDLRQQTFENLSANQTITVSHAQANQQFERPSKIEAPWFKRYVQESLQEKALHVENDFNDFDYESLLPQKLSNEGPKLLTGDLNGDQLDDFVSLGATNQQTKVFLQKQDGSLDMPFQEAIYFDLGLEATCGSLFDYNADGVLDLMIGHGGNEYAKGRSNFGLRIYINDGTGLFINTMDLPPPAGGQLSCIEGTDIDRDGDMDFFMGGRCVPGNYGLVPASFLILNEGKEGWASITTQEIGELGMVTDACWMDKDNDGDKDLFVVGEWMPITIFENGSSGIVKSVEIPDSEGLWQHIEAVDLDGDGDQDFVLGNWGENSAFKASVEEPMHMYVNDFDDNGKSEFIIEIVDGPTKIAFPFASKMELSAQLPGLKNKVLKYADFANSSYTELISAAQRKAAKTFTVKTLKTAVLWNEEGVFRLESLPHQAQVSPVFASLSQDFNKDGQVDVLLMGNQYEVKPEVGRQDANHGVLFELNQSGTFNFISNEESGLRVRGQVRDIKAMKNAEGADLILIGRNDETALTFQY